MPSQDLEFIPLPVVFLQFGSPLKVNIYFRSPVHRSYVLFKRRGEVIDISQFDQMTRTGVRLMARKDECETLAAELGNSDEILHSLEEDTGTTYWCG